MFKGTKWVVALATAIAVPCAIAQDKTTLTPDGQVKEFKAPPKMTPEEKKADIEKKRDPKKASAPMKGPNAEVGKDLQVKTMTPPPKMTAEEKKKDIELKRKGVTAEEQKNQAKTLPGG
jgi:hypothetical protein